MERATLVVSCLIQLISVSNVYEIGRRVFAPGESVPQSGIYRVTHDEHREDHPVQALTGEVFPECRKCRRNVRFRLWMEAEHMTHDWDLAGPSIALLR
jgi:hypothetical protein